MKRLFKLSSITSLLLAVVLIHSSVVYGQNYKDALRFSILYFENQRSGPLPANQRVTWRGDSALNDGKDAEVNLVGGYYDAGDNVKFGLPMAFTITTLSWGIIEYRRQLSASGELNNALAAVRWGTDYFLKAHIAPNVFYGQVGDGVSDHNCWQRPEDMTTPRTTYKIDEAHPGSELAAETAAAMAAASIAIGGSDAAYSKNLLNHANQLFTFADKFRGNYDKAIPNPFYKSISGYNDELLWAAAWLYKAGKDPWYLAYLNNNAIALGGTTNTQNEFGWDVKYLGVEILVAQILSNGEGRQFTPTFQKYQSKAEEVLCNYLGKGTMNLPKTPAGLLRFQNWNPLQFASTASLASTIYSDLLTSTNKQLKCASGAVAPNDLFLYGKFLVDYILGKNPASMSYMVGYSNKFPRYVHHRGASIVSIKKNKNFVSCKGGYATWFSSKASNPNVLTGAVVGGPDQADRYNDSRSNYAEAEACTYNTSPLVGVLARLAIRTVQDELLWAAAWLYKAGKDPWYLAYLNNNAIPLGGTTNTQNEFGWDVKYLGVEILVAQILSNGKGGQFRPTFQKYQSKAEEVLCNYLGKGTMNLPKTPAGLLRFQNWNPLQFASTASLASTIYADLLTSTNKQLKCASGAVAPNDLFLYGKFLVDYILGKNPASMSYMVGYSNKFPRYVHHRGASIVSIKKNKNFVSCKGGYATWFSSKASNPNVLTGDVVGGPDQADRYNDSRSNYAEAEACTYNTSPLVGVLARLAIR